eukprot:4191474-Amphidinium_carterae.2
MGRNYCGRNCHAFIGKSVVADAMKLGRCCPRCGRTSIHRWQIGHINVTSPADAALVSFSEYQVHIPEQGSYSAGEEDGDLALVVTQLTTLGVKRLSPHRSVKTTRRLRGGNSPEYCEELPIRAAAMAKIARSLARDPEQWTHHLNLSANLSSLCIRGDRTSLVNDGPLRQRASRQVWKIGHSRTGRAHAQRLAQSLPDCCGLAWPLTGLARLLGGGQGLAA